MATVIESVHACLPRRWKLHEESVVLATRAANQCLHQANFPANNLDLLINTGIYRDQHICEPAQASFIQQRIGANTEPHPGDQKGTFSFDLANGGCGFLVAIQIIDSFIRSGEAQSGMVVTSDMDTNPAVSEGVNFSPAGGALLLNSDHARYGFSEFYFESFPQYAHMFDANVSWVTNKKNKHLRILPYSGHTLLMQKDDRYLTTCVECSRTALDHFLKKVGMKQEEIDLIIPSHYPPGFPRALGESLATNSKKNRVVDVTDQFGAVYTAGIAASLQAAILSGQWGKDHNVLFLAVGAGILVGVALYKDKPPRTSPPNAIH
jgi:3-oxoacyl-[acyl-carrier-protein] synthase-3